MCQLGPRSLDEVPPAELAAMLDHVAARVGDVSEEVLQRAVLELLGLKRLTDNVKADSLQSKPFEVEACRVLASTKVLFGPMMAAGSGSQMGGSIVRQQCSTVLNGNQRRCRDLRFQ